MTWQLRLEGKNKLNAKKTYLLQSPLYHTSIKRPCQYKNTPQFAWSHSNWHRPRVNWTDFPIILPVSTTVLFRDFSNGRLLICLDHVKYQKKKKEREKERKVRKKAITWDIKSKPNRTAGRMWFTREPWTYILILGTKKITSRYDRSE